MSRDQMIEKIGNGLTKLFFPISLDTLDLITRSLRTYNLNAYDFAHWVKSRLSPYPISEMNEFDWNRYLKAYLLFSGVKEEETLVKSDTLLTDIVGQHLLEVFFPLNEKTLNNVSLILAESETGLADWLVWVGNIFAERGMPIQALPELDWKLLVVTYLCALEDVVSLTQYVASPESAPMDELRKLTNSKRGKFLKKLFKVVL